MLERTLLDFLLEEASEAKTTEECARYLTQHNAMVRKLTGVDEHWRDIRGYETK